MNNRPQCPDPWLLCAACGEPHRDAYIAPTGAYGLCGGCLAEAVRESALPVDDDGRHPLTSTAGEIA